MSLTSLPGSDKVFKRFDRFLASDQSCNISKQGSGLRIPDAKECIWCLRIFKQRYRPARSDARHVETPTATTSRPQIKTSNLCNSSETAVDRKMPLLHNCQLQETNKKRALQWDSRLLPAGALLLPSPPGKHQESAEMSNLLRTDTLVLAAPQSAGSAHA